MIELDQYRADEKLGATVYRGEDLNTGEIVILKHNNPAKLSKLGMSYFEALENSISRLRYESDIMRLAGNAKTCKPMDYFVDGEDHWLVMQDLGNTIDSVVEIEDKIGSLSNAAEALADLHAIEIIHRDVKPKNIAEDGTLIDFDSAYNFDLRQRYLFTAIKEGTPGYQAPDFHDDPYDAAIDVYSFSETAKEILGEDITDFNDLSTLIEEGNGPNAKDRPTIEEAVEALRKLRSEEPALSPILF